MQGQVLARFIIGIIGNVLSGLLFLSPLPTFWRITKKKSTAELHPYPYIGAVMNCLLWILYALPVIHPDSTLVITINSFGLFLEIFYLTIFFIHTKKKCRVMIIILFLLAEAAFLAVVAVITRLCFHTTRKRSMFVGIICDMFGVIMYGFPLSIVLRVVKTKRAELLSFWLCLAGFCNGIVWFIFAFVQTFDPYIATGNGNGAVVGLIQFCVYTYYTLKAKGNSSVQSEVKSPLEKR